MPNSKPKFCISNLQASTHTLHTSHHLTQLKGSHAIAHNPDPRRLDSHTLNMGLSNFANIILVSIPLTKRETWS